jgi:hypothetical protein
MTLMVNSKFEDENLKETWSITWNETIRKVEKYPCPCPFWDCWDLRIRLEWTRYFLRPRKTGIIELLSGLFSIFERSSAVIINFSMVDYTRSWSINLSVTDHHIAYDIMKTLHIICALLQAFYNIHNVSYKNKNEPIFLG